MNKLVSTIIPVYNGEKFITDAVNSALNQSYPDLEIIIVNDASTDKTEKVIFDNFKNLIGKRIFYYKNSRNRERAFSRNLGVTKAKGDFIFFLDYDDLWDRDYVKESLKYLEDFDIVYSFPRTFINEKGKVIRKSSKKIPDSVEKMIFSSLIGYPSATALKRNRYLEYRSRYIPREDWEFFIRSYKEGLKIKILDNDKVFMREHSGRTSRNPVFWKSTLKVFEDYKNSVPKEYYPLFLFSIGEICLRFGDLKTGWKLIIKALRYDPYIIKDKRKILSLLKRGFRFDKLLKKGGNPSH
ncbi:glycosyltransferase family 2 protein [Persephonella sp.]